ncbi:MAG: cell division protein ZapA [Rhodoferax sp.]|nr:cell division protein ZapA [Rhodoferax sp.]
MKQLEVQIMGQSYLLGCPAGGESRLLEAVERVDTAMCKIREAGKVRARDRIAVLAALDLAFDLGERDIPPVSMTSAAMPLTGSAYNGADHGDDAMLSTLLDRLDRALGEDGQLI